MSGVFYLTVGLPMNVSNLNRCAIALERQVDALDAQISAVTQGSVEQESLSAMRQQYAEIRDAFTTALRIPGLPQ